MLLPLVVDKAGMVQCGEATTLFSAEMSVVCCLPCFATMLLLINAVLLFGFLDVIHVVTLNPYPLPPFTPVLCQSLPTVLEAAASEVLQYLVIPPHPLASC